MAKKRGGRAYSKAHVEKQRRNRGSAIRRALFVVAVLAIVAAAVFFLVLRTGSKISVGENAIGSVLSPVQNAFSSATKWVRDFFTNWREYDVLKESYDDLYLENQQLSLQLQSAEEASRENERLKALLDAKDRYEALDPLYAKVIACDPGQWFDTFSINRGESEGVKVGMAVVTGDGLIGRVYEAGLNYAKVLCIIDSRSAVATLIERTRDNGVMRGQITASSSTPECYVYYLPNISNIVPGDNLITSGTDSLYPKGLLVGTVTAVSRNAGPEGNYVLVRPAADFQHIEEVLILRTVIETDEELNPVPSPPAKPVITATPDPAALLDEAADVGDEDDDIFHYPSAMPGTQASTAPLVEELPEDSWVNG
ncbi:MAG: rod shape-determining protein MreC [Clostridiales bacterium]|jgi:rod shape-determining protein MreC|nr:rod shape-determining protein MreC [Clostridiales bacterium]OPZ69388.1 MAG: Cell shape-determining protein MreC precursor [Firmicutes bacterium ADurb.Bin467]